MVAKPEWWRCRWQQCSIGIGEGEESNHLELRTELQFRSAAFAVFTGQVATAQLRAEAAVVPVQTIPATRFGGSTHDGHAEDDVERT
jgi:hypothetical protein